MIMADVLKIVFIILGILIIYVSYWLLAQALFPRLVENASRQYGRPVRLTLIGLAAARLTFRVGLGLPSPTDPAQPWKRVLRGGIVLAFTFLLPVVGWIIIPLWVLVSGLGAFILAAREERSQTPPVLSPELVPANT